jgi:hypothetical protein
MSRRQKKQARAPRPTARENDPAFASKDKDQYEKELKNLWNLIESSSTEVRKSIVDKLDDKLVRDLRVFANPYKRSVFTGDKNKILAFSVINISEKYSQRFAMTSLIGFLYRMLDEYKPEGAENFMSEDDPAFAAPMHKYIKQLKRQRPEDHLITQFRDVKTRIESLKSVSSSDSSEFAQLKEAARESFTIRAKLIKFHIFWTREDLGIIRERHERLERDIKNCEHHQRECEKEISELERKRDLRREKKTESLAPEDVNMKISDYEIKIKIKRDYVAKDVERHAKLTEEFEAVSTDLHRLEDRLNFLGNQFKELKVEFLQSTRRLTPTEKGSAKHRKQVKNSESIHTELDDVEVEQYSLVEDDYDEIVARVKTELGIAKTAEEYTTEVANFIEKFLDDSLRYNPDNHVRCAYKPNYEDPQRTPLGPSDQEQFDEDGKRRYERTVIPPDDTFYRWNRYTENNYEYIRQATDDIYCEKADFEFAIVPLETFEGATIEDAKADFDKFKRKYADEFDAEVFSSTYGCWNLLSPWEQNRTVRDFYTENTEIIKRIIDQHKDDQRIGMKIMKDRPDRERKKSKDSAKITDKDREALELYRKSELKPNSALEHHGARQVGKIDVEEFVPADIPRDDDESTNQEVEVGVHVIKPYIGGGRRRRIRGETDQWKFHIPAKELPEGSVNFMTAPEFQERYKKILE